MSHLRNTLSDPVPQPSVSTVPEIAGSVPETEFSGDMEEITPILIGLSASLHCCHTPVTNRSDWPKQGKNSTSGREGSRRTRDDDQSQQNKRNKRNKEAEFLVASYFSQATSSSRDFVSGFQLDLGGLFPV